MNPLVTRKAVQALLVVGCLICTAACETTGGVSDEGEPVFVAEEPAPQEARGTPMAKDGEEGEVPLVVARTEPPKDISPDTELEEVVVEAHRDRHEVILALV